MSLVAVDGVVQGSVAPGFELVAEELATAVVEESHNEPGAQLVAYRDGDLVVDLWAGDGFGPDRLTGLYSSTKGASHLVVALLVQDGVLDLGRPVVDYWPEFTGGGKERVTLRTLLAHGAGLIGLERPLTMAEIADDQVLAGLLAAKRPWWEPGTAYGYHTWVIGALTGEVVRRVTGHAIGEIWESRVRAPYGLDLYLGLPEELEARFEPVRPMRPTPAQAAELEPEDPATLGGIAFNVGSPDPDFLIDLPNTREVRAKGPASGGGVGSARGLAGLYAAALSGLSSHGEVNDGKPLLTAATIAEFSTPYLTGVDLVTGVEDAYGLGFERVSTYLPGLGEDAFGHCGVGGSVGFADPRTGLAYGYLRRRFAYPGGPASENERLVRALVAAAE